MRLSQKIDNLMTRLGGMSGAIVAYSGGADSAFLAEAANRALGIEFIAVLADSPSLPRRELRAARLLAERRDWPFLVIKTAELEDERYAANPYDRCFFCKSALFDALTPMARKRNVPMLLGTNVDDLGDWRPGQQAASQRGALQPLVEAHLTKAEIRAASYEWGLPTHDKPAAACLSSRFAYGVGITAEGLERIEKAEDSLIALGFRVVRVRDLGFDRARVEVDIDEISALVELGDRVVALLEGLGFRDVLLDPKGYRQGALNEGIPVEISRAAP